MSLSCIRAKVEVLRIVVCGSCLAVYTCKNSEGSASKLLLSQMQGACKNYRENLKMSRYEVKHTGGSGRVAHYQMMAKISLFSIYFLPFVPMDHFPALVSSGHCPPWQWKSSELCTTPPVLQYNSLFCRCQESLLLKIDNIFKLHGKVDFKEKMSKISAFLITNIMVFFENLDLQEMDPPSFCSHRPCF